MGVPSDRSGGNHEKSKRGRGYGHGKFLSVALLVESMLISRLLVYGYLHVSLSVATSGRSDADEAIERYITFALHRR